MDKPLTLRLVLIYSMGFAVAPALPQNLQSPAQQPASSVHQASGPANGPGNSTLESGRSGEIISVEDGRLTLKVVSRAMDSVVSAIISTTHVPIVDIEAALDRHKVDFDFRGMPLDEALKLILKDYDTFFLYATDGNLHTTLRQVWIYAKGRGRGFDPIPHEACASGKELRSMVRERDPDVKARAFEALVEREGSKAQDVVGKWVNSTDELERNLALFYGMENNVPLPAETLRALAVEDNSPEIRYMALEALAATDPRIAQAVFQQALKDPDARVRAKAQEIVDGLNGSTDEANGPN